MRKVSEPQSPVLVPAASPVPVGRADFPATIGRWAVCPNHDTAATTFCRSCQIFLCATQCALAEHSAHDLQAIPSTSAIYHATREELIQSTLAAQEGARQREIELQTQTSAFLAQGRSQVNQIRNVISTCIAEIQEMEKDLIDQVVQATRARQLENEKNLSFLSESSTRLLAVLRQLRPLDSITSLSVDNLDILSQAKDAISESNRMSSSIGEQSSASEPLLSTLSLERPLRSLVETLSNLSALSSAPSLAVSSPQSNISGRPASPSLLPSYHMDPPSMASAPQSLQSLPKFSDPNTGLAPPLTRQDGPDLGSTITYAEPSQLRPSRPSGSISDIDGELWRSLEVSSHIKLTQSLDEDWAFIDYELPPPSADPPLPIALEASRIAAPSNQPDEQPPPTEPRQESALSDLLQSFAPAPALHKVLLTCSQSLLWHAVDLETFTSLDWPAHLRLESPVVCAAQNANNPSTLFVVFSDGMAAVLDIKTQKLVRDRFPVDAVGARKAMVVEDPKSFDAVAFVVIADHDRTISAYSRDAIRSFTLTVSSGIISATASHAGDVILGTSDGCIIQQELFAKQSLRRHWKAHTSAITCLNIINPTADVPSLISASLDGHLKCWRLDKDSQPGNETPSWQLAFHEPIVSLAAISPDDHSHVIACGTQSGDICIVSSTGDHVTFRAHNCAPAALAFCGTRLVSTGGSHDRSVRSWIWQTGSPVATLGTHGGGVYQLQSFDSGRKCLTASADGTVNLWNLDTNSLLLTFSGHSGLLTCLAMME